MTSKALRKLALCCILAVASVATVAAVLPAAYGDEPPLAIVAQPTDQTISYPDGAEFSVQVNRTDVTYQWYQIDKALSPVPLRLQGYTGNTDTLRLPSTTNREDGMKYYCIITASDGSTVTSDEAALHVSNASEDKVLYYFLDYVVRPGETLDLAAHGLGSGTISFDADERTLTMDNVNCTVNEDSFSVSSHATPARGLQLCDYVTDGSGHVVKLQGQNEITDELFLPASNSAGLPVNFFVHDGESGNASLVIEGPGTLALHDGTYAIYAKNIALEIDADITVENFTDHYANGIYAGAIKIDEGRNIVMDNYGSCLCAHAGNLAICSGANLDLTAHAPHVGQGSTVAYIAYAAGSVSIENAVVNAKGTASPEQFSGSQHIDTFSGISAGMAMRIADSQVTVFMNADGGDQPYASKYANRYAGITAGSGGLMEISKSKVDVTIDGENINGAYGVDIFGRLHTSLSEINVDVTAKEVAVAFEAQDKTVIKDSNLTGKATLIGDGLELGVALTKPTIDLADSSYAVTGIANTGIGLCAKIPTDPDEPIWDPVEYDPDYEPSEFAFVGDTTCIFPEDYVINQSSYVFGDYKPVETFYVKGQTDKPASKAVVSVEETPGPQPDPDPDPVPDPTPDPNSEDSLPETGDVFDLQVLSLLLIATVSVCALSATMIRRKSGVKGE